MNIKNDTNENGVLITIFRCEKCFKEFSVCPFVPLNELKDYKCNCEEDNNIDDLIEII